MGLHINKFVDRIRSLDTRGQREFVMSLSEAKDLHADITKLLLQLQILHEQSLAKAESNTVTEINVDGGGF